MSEEKITEKNYYLHPWPYLEVLKALEKELDRIEKSGKKTIWYHSGRKTLHHLKRGKEYLLKKGRKGEIPLTPYDVNNIVYVLLRQLAEVSS